MPSEGGTIQREHAAQLGTPHGPKHQDHPKPCGEPPPTDARMSVATPSAATGRGSTLTQPGLSAATGAHRRASHSQRPRAAANVGPRCPQHCCGAPPRCTPALGPVAVELRTRRRRNPWPPRHWPTPAPRPQPGRQSEPSLCSLRRSCSTTSLHPSCVPPPGTREPSRARHGHVEASGTATLRSRNTPPGHRTQDARRHEPQPACMPRTWLLGSRRCRPCAHRTTHGVVRLFRFGPAQASRCQRSRFRPGSSDIGCLTQTPETRKARCRALSAQRRAKLRLAKFRADQGRFFFARVPLRKPGPGVRKGPRLCHVLPHEGGGPEVTRAPSNVLFPAPGPPCGQVHCREPHLWPKPRKPISVLVASSRVDVRCRRDRPHGRPAPCCATTEATASGRGPGCIWCGPTSRDNVGMRAPMPRPPLQT